MLSPPRTIVGAVFGVLAAAMLFTSAGAQQGSFIEGPPGRGVEFAVHSGGPVAGLALAAPDAESFFTTVDGKFVGYIVGAPDFVNAAFNTHFALGVPPNTPLIVFTPLPQSGVAGLVTLGPNCPVIQQDNPCPDTPFEAELVITTSEGVEVTRTSSGTDGRYRVAVVPGEYVIVPQSPSGLHLPFAGR